MIYLVLVTTLVHCFARWLEETFLKHSEFLWFFGDCELALTVASSIVYSTPFYLVVVCALSMGATWTMSIGYLALMVIVKSFTASLVLYDLKRQEKYAIIPSILYVVYVTFI